MEETPSAPGSAPEQSIAPPSPVQQPLLPPPPLPPPPLPPRRADTDDAHRGRRIGGIVLIVLGLLFYAQYFLPALSWATLWPAILIVLGIYILLKGRRS